MRVLRTVADVRAWRRSVKEVGLVPTMGALHDGHLSLVDTARRGTRAVVVSIFVNPTQFGPHEDFAAYPRDEARDAALLEARAVDAVFAPPVPEMYPPGDETRVRPGKIASGLEGAARPGHFEGVCTVVAKLFAIVQPDVAYFGQKDFQQLRVMQTMTRDLRLPVRIQPCPTVRDADGLAVSSRNRYLDAEERLAATALSRGLFAAEAEFARGERRAATLGRRVEDTVKEERRCRIEYVSAADPWTLAQVEGEADAIVLSLAARVGKARLIDNVLLGVSLEELGT